MYNCEWLCTSSSTQSLVDTDGRGQTLTWGAEWECDTRETARIIDSIAPVSMQESSLGDSCLIGLGYSRTIPSPLVSEAINMRRYLFRTHGEANQRSPPATQIIAPRKKLTSNPCRILTVHLLHVTSFPRTPNTLTKNSLFRCLGFSPQFILLVRGPKGVAWTWPLTCNRAFGANYKTLERCVL